MKNPGKEQCNHPWICWKKPGGRSETGSVTAVDLESRIFDCRKKWTSLFVIQFFRANHPHLVATLCSSFTRENGHPVVIRSSLSTAQFQFLTLQCFGFWRISRNFILPRNIPKAELLSVPKHSRKCHLSR